jgi:hypothetical protein
VADIIPELSAVQSEALQSKIRDLLPSQQGFGTDLIAQNVIVPVVDLTEAAEGSSLPESLNQAWDFSTTQVAVSGSGTTTIINNTGFWKVRFQAGLVAAGAGVDDLVVSITDGLSTKPIWDFEENLTSNNDTLTFDAEFYVFLRSGDSLTCTRAGSGITARFHFRQVATLNGTLVNPQGFSPQ